MKRTKRNQPKKKSKYVEQDSDEDSKPKKRGVKRRLYEDEDSDEEIFTRNSRSKNKKRLTVPGNNTLQKYLKKAIDEPDTETEEEPEEPPVS